MDLFAALHATWPAAATLPHGPWTIRVGEGAGRRASAVTLEGEDGDPAEALALARRLAPPPLFLVRAEQTALDARLASLGFRREAPTLLLAGDAAALAHAEADLTVIDCAGPIAIMAALWREGGTGLARIAAMERACDPRRFLLGRIEDRPAGAGFAAVAGQVAMLHALHVAPWARRRGLARRLAQWAADWGARNGAGTLAVAVEAANAPARALFEGLGLEAAGAYHYRVAPD